MNTSDIYARTTRNRLEIAELLETLSPAQWRAETLCTGWTVRHMAAHFVQPMLIGFGRFFLTSIRYRGNTAATIDHFTRLLARRDPADLIALLRRRAHDRVDPPRVGPIGPFAETCIHLRDIARPLGLDADARHEDWQHGDGPDVRGTFEALTMAITGRHCAIEDLDGAGAATLRTRVS